MTDDVNLRVWASYFKAPSIHASRREWLRKDTKVFTMGSCFAVSVRNALIKAGIQVHPDYVGVEYDRATQIFDKIPHERTMFAHYDTFVVRQEVEAALGLWPDRSQGFYRVNSPTVNRILKGSEAFQDPYRKLNYALTLPLLEELAGRITHSISRGLSESDILIFTLGLTEVWQHRKTGKYLCQAPTAGLGGVEDNIAVFRQSTFLENYENVRTILDLVFERYPNKKVVISVSPVRLGSTFAKTDVATANTESKSILRAVAGQICREYPDNVLYFPSYEMALMGIGALTGTGSVFEPDGRHIQDSFVEMATNSFMQVIS